MTVALRYLASVATAVVVARSRHLALFVVFVMIVACVVAEKDCIRDIDAK